MVHDYGLAPNPFGAYCTLAVCKPLIRNNNNLEIGDWIIATGGVKLHAPDHLIYAMKVSEIITMQKYWNDKRFQYKKPIPNGSLMQIYGDNIYHYDENVKNPKITDWQQADSAHSLDGGKLNVNHRNVDVGHGSNVLVATEFYYWGENAIPIPSNLKDVCHKGIGMRYDKIEESVRSKFVEWLRSKYRPGIYGKPTNWKKDYNIKKNYLSCDEEE